MSDDLLAGSPLGKLSQASNGYSPALLYPISRAAGRHSLMQETQTLPFHGVDQFPDLEGFFKTREQKARGNYGQFH